MLLKELDEINTRTVNALKKKHIYTTNDMVKNIPRKYKDYSKVVSLLNATIDEENAIKCHFLSFEEKGDFIKKYLVANCIDEESGEKLKIFWFGSYYLKEYIRDKEGKNIVVCGKLTKHEKFGYQITNPDVFEPSESFKPKFFTVYKKFKGVSEDTNLEQRRKMNQEITKIIVLI